MKEAVRDLVMRMTGGRQDVADICAKVVEAVGRGDVCAAIDDAELALLASAPEVAAFSERGAADGSPEPRPFIVCGNLAYTRRNWLYERRVETWVRSAAAGTGGSEALVPPVDDGSGLREEQRAAVAAMLRSRFSILAGGPGTGKTHTLAHAVRIARAANPDLRLGLAAPTGKAAARMVESMRRAMGDAPLPHAATIHSLLEPRHTLVSFRHDRSNPLPLDWLIVDEASMVDLPLMAKLLDALPPQCRLTLVGDENQLASVERGRVFADLCRLAPGSVGRLEESRRFRPGGDIDLFARAVNEGRPDDAMRILGGAKDLSFEDISEADPFKPGSWPRFDALVMEGFAAFAACRDAEGAMEHLNDFRILCALRRGPFGVERLNGYMRSRLGPKAPVPMMVSRNDEALGVANGDVGVVMPDSPNTLLLPYGKGLRSLRLELLDGVEPAFATTVHKSQGSEFGDVALVLPPGRCGADEAGLLVREILYTGITRTQNRAAIFASEDAIRMCCGRRISRTTGL